MEKADSIIIQSRDCVEKCSQHQQRHIYATETESHKHNTNTSANTRTNTHVHLRVIPTGEFTYVGKILPEMLEDD